MSEEFMDEIDRSFIEDGDPEPVHIRLAKAEHRIRELEASNRLLRKQRVVAAEELGKIRNGYYDQARTGDEIGDVMDYIEDCVAALRAAREVFEDE